LTREKGQRGGKSPIFEKRKKQGAGKMVWGKSNGLNQGAQRRKLSACVWRGGDGKEKGAETFCLRLRRKGRTEGAVTMMDTMGHQRKKKRFESYSALRQNAKRKGRKRLHRGIVSVEKKGGAKRLGPAVRAKKKKKGQRKAAFPCLERKPMEEKI